MDDLKSIREKIDAIDNRIVELLDQRFLLVDQVFEAKKKNQIKIDDQIRESQIITRLITLAKHPVLKEKIFDIFKELMNETKIGQQLYLFNHFPFQNVGIIGLGLIGGSIAKTLRIKDDKIHVRALDLDKQTIQAAINDHVLDKQSSLDELVETSDLIFISVPLQHIIPIARQISEKVNHRAKKLIVVDTGSVKREICSEFEKLSNEKVEFLASHPMVGKETSSYFNSEMSLAAKTSWMIIPHEKNTQSAIEQMEQVIQFLGAIPLRIENGEIHDKQTALISHIPAFLSSSYYNFVLSSDPESVKVAGPGFKSFTRLAHDNPEMWKQIHHLNRDNLVSGIKQWIKSLQDSLD